MNGIDNPIIFYPAAIVMILSAVFTVWFRNIFYSLLSAIIVFFITGMFFYVLGSEYNAVIQIAVYGFAVPIILGLAIMFTNSGKPVNHIENKLNSIIKFLIILACGVFILAIIYLILTSLAIEPMGFNISENAGAASQGVITAFSQGLYTKYVWSFELISLILTIVAVGLTLFKNENRKDKTWEK